MTKRVPKQSIVVQRPVGFPDNAKDEKTMANYVPPLNQPFDFTADEIRQIEKMNPAALGTTAEVDVTAGNTDGAPIPPESVKNAPANATTTTPLASNATKPDAAAQAKTAAAKTGGKSAADTEL